MKDNLLVIFIGFFLVVLFAYLLYGASMIFPLIASMELSSPTTYSIIGTITLIAIVLILWIIAHFFYRNSQKLKNTLMVFLILMLCCIGLSIYNYLRYKFYNYQYGILTYVEDNKRYVYNRYGKKLWSTYTEEDNSAELFEPVIDYFDDKCVIQKLYVKDRTEGEYTLTIWTPKGNYLGNLGTFFRDGSPRRLTERKTLPEYRILSLLSAVDALDADKLKELYSDSKNAHAILDELLRLDQLEDSYLDEVFANNYSHAENSLNEDNIDLERYNSDMINHWGKYFDPQKIRDLLKEANEWKESHSEQTIEFVDLGLSTDWATCNLGASSPEEFGDYYQWGSPMPSQKFEKDYLFELLQSYTLKKYGVYDFENKKITPQFDAATFALGGEWRLPNWSEVEELVLNCTWEEINIKGYKCMVITGPSGNSIVLPYAGYKSEEYDKNEEYYHKLSRKSIGTQGIYWTTQIWDYEEFADNLSAFRGRVMYCNIFDDHLESFLKQEKSSSFGHYNWDRVSGIPIRAVHGKRPERLNELNNKRIEKLIKYKQHLSANESSSSFYYNNTYTPYYDTSSPTQSKGHSCTLCEGSGRKIVNHYVGGSERKWCPECNAEVYIGHSHTTCDLCHGDGWFDPATD